MKKIGIIGTSGTIAKPSQLTTKDFLSKVGANTGNLLFQYAVYEAIAEDKLIIGQDISWDISKIQESCRIIVIPSANFIRENFDLSAYVDFLEKCKLPLLFLGIGVQADNFQKKNFDLHPSIVKLIDLFKDRSIGVGVRGEYTAEVLNMFGFKNSIVIGCPSNFINPDENLPEKLWAKWNSNAITLATTGDEPWPKNPDKKNAERLLFKWAVESNGIYVQQSVEPFVRAIRMGNPYSENCDSLDGLDKLRIALAPSMNEIDFKRFITSSVRLYSDVSQWMEDLSRFDLSIGLRLHGNMVPFQAGCPSVWVYHDARTKELIETMSLPHVSLPDFLKLDQFNSLKEICEFDYLNYKKTRKILYERYKSLYLAANIAV